jgi:hypothetical protein
MTLKTLGKITTFFHSKPLFTEFLYEHKSVEKKGYQHILSQE